ncbi:hypothetical protein BDR07DRAFT_1298450 [Suillus spraguei]|nr:hypothetical protein BDR07DRAFT_1298450 [Suillus spraguei]
MHDDFHLSHHPIFKNLCNAGGCVTNELGSSLILSRQSSFNGTSIKALSCSVPVIFPTIHALGSADVNGDHRSGQRTLPIQVVTPKGSCIYMLCALLLFSVALASSWSLGPFSTVIFILMGSWVGIRYFLFHDEIPLKLPPHFRSLQIWLVGIHLLPANVHFCAFQHDC